MIYLVSRNNLLIMLFFLILGVFVTPSQAQHADPAQGQSVGSGEAGAFISGVMRNGVTGVFLHSGELFVQETDLVVPSRGMDFMLIRRYEAQAVYNGPLGWGWDYNYHRRLRELPSGNINYYDGLGRVELFKAVRAGGLPTGAITEYKAPTGVFAELKKLADGTWALVFRGLYNETYDTYGRLIRMQDRNSNHMEFYYSPGGLLSNVMDTMGRLYSFEYWPIEYDAKGGLTAKSNRLKSVTDYAGRVIEYGYDEEEGDLTDVRLGERVRRYSYLNPQTDNLRLMHNLATIRDPLDQVALEVAYSGDKVVSEKIGDSTVLVASGQTATTTDGAGHVRTYVHDAAGHAIEFKEGSSTTTYNYNDDGLVTKITYPLGNWTELTYDEKNANRRSQADLLQVKAHPDARGGQELVTSYRYDTWSNQLVYARDPKGHETIIGLDTQYNTRTITAPENAVTTFVRDSFGRVRTRTSRNRVTRYEYYPETAPTGDSSPDQSARPLDPSEGGYLESVTEDPDGDGIKRTFTYDQRGNLRTETDGMGGLTTYDDPTPQDQMQRVVADASDVHTATLIGYDLNGNVHTRTEGGVTETYGYNKVNLPVEITRCCGADQQGQNVEHHLSFTYYGDFNIQTQKDSRGITEKFEYDPQDRLVKRTRNDHPREQYVYDDNGNPTTVVDGMGRGWTRRYDGHDRLAATVDPLGNEVKFTPDEDSNITKIEAPEGFTADFVHDGLGRLRQSTQSGGIQEDFDYDSKGSLWHYTPPNRSTWTITNTGSGLLHEVLDPVGNKTHHEYDQRGFQKSMTETDTNNRTLTHTTEFDFLGRLRKQDDDLGRRWSVPVLDEHARPALRIDPENGGTDVAYDGFGRVHAVTRYVDGQPPQKTIYWHDGNGNITDIDDALGNRTHYEYDDLDRFSFVRYADNAEEHYTYNDNDQVSHVDQWSGTKVDIRYDDADRMKTRTITRGANVGGSTIERFSYDGLGRLKTASNNSTNVEISYDPGGRVATETVTLDGVSYVVASGYDAAGNKTSLTYPSNTAVAITPDLLNRIHTITTPEGANIATYTYEGVEKIVGKALGHTPTDRSAPSVLMTGNYDNGKRPEWFEYKAADGKELLGRTDLIWDRRDLKTSEKKSEEGSAPTGYAYDKAWRLTEVTEPAKKTTYTIDAADSIKQIDEAKGGVTTTTDYTTNNRHQVTIMDGRTLTYDANGNVASVESPDGTQVRYFYDWRNQLVKVDDGQGKIVEYVYDALGRRVERKVSSGGANPVVTRYVNDGWRTIEERDGANQVVGRYVYGNGIDEPLQIEKRDPTSGALERFIPMQDTNGSVLSLANAEGKVVERVKYTAYGRPTFVYDHEPPLVDQVRVVDGSLRIRFSEAVDDASARDAIKVKQTGSVLAGAMTFAEGGRLITFAPSGSLPQGQVLTLEVSTVLRDASANALANGFVATFTPTGVNLLVYDRAPPRIQSVKLLSGAIKIEFDEEIDPASIPNSPVLLDGQTTVPGIVALEGEKTLTLTPSSPLAVGTHYLLKVKISIADLSGRTLAEEHDVHFVYAGHDQALFDRPPDYEHETSYVGNTTTFQGRDYDSDVHLAYFRNRYLSPEIGRFLQPDPMGCIDSANLYEGFGNNPGNFLDPMGLSQADPRGALGELGEKLAKYYLQRQGYTVLLSGVRKGVYQRGFDLLAVKGDEVLIIDNKAFLSRRTVSSASALVKNLQPNMRAAIEELTERLASKDLSAVESAAVRRAMAALSKGSYKLVVTGCGGIARGVGAGLAARGVEFKALGKGLGRVAGIILAVATELYFTEHIGGFTSDVPLSNEELEWYKRWESGEDIFGQQ